MGTRHDQTGNRSSVTSRRSSSNRQIVVCCDGTSNSLTARTKDTNVLQLHERLRAERDRRAQDGLPGEQVLYYDPGVGSAVGLPPTGLVGFATAAAGQVAGLALGRGVYENIGQAYLHLCREYGRDAPAVDPVTGRPPSATTDEIWLFGFSRGAFTVRAVGGMLNLFGLIRPEHEALLPTLLSVYFAEPDPEDAAEAGGGMSAADRAVGVDRDLVASRQAASERALGAGVSGGVARSVQLLGRKLSQQPGVMTETTELAEPMTRRSIAAQIRREFTTPIGHDARVRFLGVWDTVDSVGILPGSRKRISSAPTIHRNRYDHVRHALSLDEHRRQFLPRYFDARTAPGQTLRQLWFRGVHADVGGSRPASRSMLSFETLRWMVDEAVDCGLRVPRLEPRSGPLPIVEVIGDQLRAKPAWALTGMALRDPSRAPGEGHDGDLPVSPAQTAKVLRPLEHPSVEVFTREGPGRRGPGAPRSPWERGNGPAPLALAGVVLLTALLSGCCFLVAGALATPGSVGWAFGDALRAGFRLVGDQLGMSWSTVGSGGHTIASRVDAADARLEWWAAADRAGARASYGWAQLFALAGVLGLSTIAARLPARAFSRLTRWRRVDDPYPRPPWLMNALGLGFAVMVLSYVVQAVALILAWDVGGSALRAPLVVIAAEAGVVSGVGALLTAGLLARWGLGEVRGR